jgi:hypothetical protein
MFMDQDWLAPTLAVQKSREEGDVRVFGCVGNTIDKPLIVATRSPRRTKFHVTAHDD